MVADFERHQSQLGALTMEMSVEGQRIVIKGNPGLSLARASLKSMVKTMQEGVGFLVELQSLKGVESKEKGNIPLIVQPLLQQFREVFQSPVGLPPVRACHHVERKGGPKQCENIQIPSGSKR